MFLLLHIFVKSCVPLSRSLHKKAKREVSLIYFQFNTTGTLLLLVTELYFSDFYLMSQEEWWEMAGEISERKGDTKAAVEYYAKGNNFARAVQLAREVKLLLFYFHVYHLY